MENLAWNPMARSKDDLRYDRRNKHPMMRIRDYARIRTKTVAKRAAAGEDIYPQKDFITQRALGSKTDLICFRNGGGCNMEKYFRPHALPMTTKKI